ncbi:MAG: CHASE domain-containing protein [Pontixanthobacter sp.]
MAHTSYPDHNPRRLLSAYPRAVPVALFVLIAAITALSIYSIEISERSREEAQLSERAKTVAAALERRSAIMASYLRAGSALFGTVDEVTPELFDDFVSNLRADTGAGSTDGIGWAPWIDRSDIAAFEESYREDTGRPIALFPDATTIGGRVLPVTFLRPDSERNRRAIGFNMVSEATRREGLREAARLGSPVASGKLTLLQEGDKTSAGFIVYMPVYTQASDLEEDAADTRGTGMRRVRGFIYAPFNAEQFLENAIEEEIRTKAGLRLYDCAITPDRLLAEIAPSQNTGVTMTEPVTIANHEMILVAESARGGALTPLSMLTLLFGIMVASLLMLLVRLLAKQTVEDETRLAWLEEQNSIRNSLTRELNHRVKNTLANVLSIMALTRRRAKSLDDFADSLDGRIRALSATHDLLTQSEWSTTPIREVIEAEMAPYAQESDTMLDLDGPDVEIAPNDALSLGMAIHELATNAAKYGALSRSGGKVSVGWEKLNEGFARLDWKETGGPPVSDERRSGFGTNLIEKIVAHELRNPVDLQFNPAGVACTMIVPLRKPSDFAIRASRLV